jgi:hypothetical protein
MPGRHSTERGSAGSTLGFTGVGCRWPCATALGTVPALQLGEPVPVDCQHELLYTRVDNQQETLLWATPSTKSYRGHSTY